MTTPIDRTLDDLATAAADLTIAAANSGVEYDPRGIK